MHSHHSDGLHEPEALVEMAVGAGLRAIALTDHDTVTGWPAFAAACDGAGIEAIPGVELSGRFRERDAHVLGYFVRPDDPALGTALERFRRDRAERGREMVRRLNGIGVGLSYAAVERGAGDAVIGRPHVADALCGGGFVRTYDEAFKRYLGLNKPAYVAKTAFGVDEAIALIHAAGGLAVLAHPGGHYSAEDIEDMVGNGLDGVEIVHPRHTSQLTQLYADIAYRHGLVTTGGSDFHGSTRGSALVGDPGIDYTVVETLKERASWAR